MRYFLQQIGNFSDEEVAAIESAGIPKRAPAKATLFTASAPFLKLWFITEGMMRTYRIIEGEDYTFFFFTKNDFAVDYESFLTEEQSPLFFEALVDITYLEFSKPTILALYDRFPRFEKVGRIMAERAYLSATERLKQFQAGDLETRYKNLLSRDPELFQKIPQYHIASYLGVKPQSLSRLKAKLAGKSY